MEKAKVRWKHPEAGRFTSEFDGHQLGVWVFEDGLWHPEVDGKAAPAHFEDQQMKFMRADMAKDAAVMALMPKHAKTGPWYCDFAEGLPPGWQCGRDKFWPGHTDAER